MQLFRDSEGDFQTLFKLRDIRGLTYWSNFAVSRFTGYQRQDRLFTLNGVVLLGGISSVAALLVAWALAQLGILATHAEQNPYVTCAELVFWLVVAYLTGIVVWNLSIIPHYILKRHHRNTV